MALTKIGASLGGGADTISVTQNSHGLSIGYPVKVSGNGTFAHATADSEANADAVGIIIESTTNTMLIALSGKVTVDAALPSGNVAAGTVLYLPVSAGKLTSTEPTGNTQISKPMAVVSYLNSEMILINYRGEVISTAGVSIADDSVTNAKLANTAAYTVKGNATSSSANPTDISLASATGGYSIHDNDIVLVYDADGSALKTITRGNFLSGVGGLTTKIGYFQWDSANSAGNQAVTGLGFQPSLIIFDSNIHNDKFHSLGMAATNVVSGSANNTTTFQTSPGSGSSTTTATRVAIWDRSPASADTYQSNIDRVIFGWTGNSTGTWVQGDISSYDSDGFTIAWTKSGSPSGTVNINYVAFK